MRKAFFTFIIVAAIVGTIMGSLTFLFSIFISPLTDDIATNILGFKNFETSSIGFAGKVFRNIIIMLVLAVWGKKTKKWQLLLVFSIIIFYLGYQNFMRFYFFSGILIMIGALFGIVGGFKEGIVSRQKILTEETERPIISDENNVRKFNYENSVKKDD